MAQHTDEDSTPNRNLKKLDRKWAFVIAAVALLGLVAGFVIREIDATALGRVAGWVGFFATIFGVGVSNVFVADKSLHYSTTTQRVASIIAVLALGLSAPTFFLP